MSAFCKHSALVSSAVCAVCARTKSLPGEHNALAKTMMKETITHARERGVCAAPSS